HVRTWAIRFLTDNWPLDTVVSQRPGGKSEEQPRSNSLSPLAESARLSELPRDPLSPLGERARVRGYRTLEELISLAKTDNSGLVRLALASTLQRLPVSKRANLAAPLLAHTEDATDHNLPLLIWYGLIPVGDAYPAALAKLAAKTELPVTRKFIARRLSEDIEKNPAPLNELLKIATGKAAAFQADILNGMSDGLIGWRKARKPAAWDALAAKLASAPILRDRVRELSVVFG